MAEAHVLPTCLDNELFNRLTRERGAVFEKDRAALVGINRNTLLRLRNREFTASLPVARKMAETLGTTVEELFGVAS